VTVQVPNSDSSEEKRGFADRSGAVLTARENEVLPLMAEGLTTKKIATRLLHRLRPSSRGCRPRPWPPDRLQPQRYRRRRPSRQFGRTRRRHQVATDW